MSTLFITNCGKGLHFLGSLISLIAIVSGLNSFALLGAGMNELVRPFEIEYAIGVVIWLIGSFCWLLGKRIEERSRIHARMRQTPPH